MIGKEILNYIIVSKIGDGGMGTVYLAEHKFIQQQKVAIKVIRKDMVNESSRRRLQEEAEHLAGLNHPNIVKFLNYHIDNEGNVYLIMEYAEGDTLAQYIRTKTGLIVESRILPIFEPILDAFDYAHKKKVIHRDIKPSNIIVTPDGTPKILDFGISTILDENVDEGKEEAFIMGTPSFMSPEQVRGQGIDFRSDRQCRGVPILEVIGYAGTFHGADLIAELAVFNVGNDVAPSVGRFVDNDEIDFGVLTHQTFRSRRLGAVAGTGIRSAPADEDERDKRRGDSRNRRCSETRHHYPLSESDAQQHLRYHEKRYVVGRCAGAGAVAGVRVCGVAGLTVRRLG